jgi:hypothetical protein
LTNHIENLQLLPVHVPIYTDMLPPHFLMAPRANSFCIQSIIHLKAPVLIYKIRVESGNRIADTDSSARVIWTACWVLLLATVEDAGLPSMLALAPFWPAIFPLAEPPQLLTAATCQAGNINASILGGMDLSKDIWEFILQQPALGVVPVCSGAGRASRTRAHTTAYLSTPFVPTVLAPPGYQFVALAGHLFRI